MLDTIQHGAAADNYVRIANRLHLIEIETIIGFTLSYTFLDSETGSLSYSLIRFYNRQ